jgi:hypothetical protein
VPLSGFGVALFLPDEQGNRLDMIGLRKEIHRLNLLQQKTIVD